MELRLNPRGLGTKRTYLLSKNGDTLLREGSMFVMGWTAEERTMLGWIGEEETLRSILRGGPGVKVSG